MVTKEEMDKVDLEIE